MMNFFRRLKIEAEPEETQDEQVQPLPVDQPLKKLHVLHEEEDVQEEKDAKPVKPVKAAKAPRPKRIKPVKLKVKAKEKEKATFDAPEEQVFWVSYGPILKNLYELKDTLREMSEEQFNYHTKRDGNDFANWIEHVFKDLALAKKVRKAKTKEELATVLEKYLQ